ncbi:MAG TPA: hypothetical protein VJY62_15085 [Bacteroidia bacterium]|nr:hypothetical protein [Bacteroidia bacterium]
MKSYKVIVDCHISFDKKTKKELVSLTLNRAKLFLENDFVAARKISFAKIKEEQYARLELRVITHNEIDKTALQEFLFANISSKYFSAAHPEAVTVEAWDIYYQPALNDAEWGVKLYSFQVYDSKVKAQKDFPDKEILEYSGDAIENPTYVNYKK